MSDTAGCRILVVSPSASRAHQFVERVQALSASHAASVERASESAAAVSVYTTIGGSQNPLSAGSSSSIPWTIVNKYYTADVHFETHEFEHFRTHHAIGVPAVIYVWAHGEPYKDHIPEIAQKIKHYDPEVSLAVRFQGDSLSAPTTSPSAEDDGLDEFLSSHGFEFVEGERAYRRPTQDLDRHSDDEDSGIPGLPRVIDALSTIMWPSLVQSQATRQRKSRARELLGWALEEEADDGLRALIADPSASSADSTAAIAAAATSARKSRMQREMEELERWLEDEETSSGARYSRDRKDGTTPEGGNRTGLSEDEDVRAREWVTSAPVSSVEGWEDMLTPPTIRTPRPDDEHHVTSDGVEHGFEDDFADFVSATSDLHLSNPSHGFGLGHGLGHGEDRLLEVNYDVARLTPMHTGASYRSLASISDFGGEEGMFVGRESLGGAGYGALGDEDGDGENDPDLPSRAEILETSRKLFGAAAFAPPPEPISASSSAAAQSSPLQAREPSNITNVTSSGVSAADRSLDSEEGDDGDEDHSFAPFDLSRVFSALQGMKAEIAGMEDEEERRRAAARVALGLVYGLGAQDDGPARRTPGPDSQV
ncbi:hypothetical protein C8Q77DRAFT_1060132 [Trametes polyzona]|nr:hypothetical protein C8Q77DRAFT_1060132 [Trametes polyzona]